MRRTIAIVGIVVSVISGCSDAGDTTTSPDSTAPSDGSTTSSSTGSGDGGGSTDSTPSVGTDGDAPARSVEFITIAQVDEPIDLRQRPGTDTLFVASRQGRIHAIDDGDLADDPLLDISGRTNADGEQGLLGFTFSPDGALLYVHFTDRNGDSNVEEYVIDGNRAEPDSRRTILVQAQPFSNHNGGSITFGPDGLLYIGLGDGGSAGDPQGNGQALDTWLGKLLRVDPSGSGDAPYDIPADNPFATSGGRPEIWSWGLRNPWRFSFDRATGDLWVGDVGQGEIEEVSRSTVAQGAGGGVNFGWRRFEGDAVFDDGTEAPGAVPPAFSFTHSGDGACSVTGGFVYRGTALPWLQGAYVFTDLCWTGVKVWWSDTRVIEDLGGEMNQVVSFAEDLDGELYVLSFEGAVYQMVAGP